MSFEEKLKELNPVDMDMMIEILHNANITVNYNCDNEPSYTVSQKDMIKLMNYVYKVLR